MSEASVVHPSQQSQPSDERRWQALQERCIAITGKTLPDLAADETMRVVNLFSTEDRAFALKHLERFSGGNGNPPAAAKPIARKVKPPKEERVTLADAFYLGDNLDEERALRAAALLLEWASDIGNEKVDGFLVFGISRALYLAADRRAQEIRRLHENSHG